MSPSWPELDAQEHVLVDPDELIWRNVNPDWIEDDGKLTSQAFRPTPKDEMKLSGARSSKIDAAGHHREFTEGFGLQSVGVWAVSVEEVSKSSLRCIDDSESPSAPEPCPVGHTYVDFRGHAKSKFRRLGSTLRDLAEKNGCQHPR